eukprot:CAMPEP_0174737342 /NCGR_PEP_ID=MMETSP1094-20130205/68176_1 /TAXON_ID=156173 /ORGANISM="Chrysochromulina brevifilum, Strain UTEX LB 985" /LENGTH=91 /DNA_ID=CAMNT_0015940563 /DNA_START=21 /DNA_END=293 /DNA_ORIENTATION=+
MASIFNITKNQRKKVDPDEEATMLAMWTASADIGVKCSCAAFNSVLPDGKIEYLAVGTDDGAISIFNPKTGRHLSKLGASAPKQSDSMMAQ